MAKKENIPIKYTNREFSSIRSDLISYVKRYYPDTFKDFNEASFGSLMLDTVAYVGDTLSFYLDYQANESFLDTAVETNNVIRLGRQLGYRFDPFASSYGKAAFYVLVPANSNGIGVNTDYIPVLKRGSTFSSNGGANFILSEDVDFSGDSTEIIAAKFNDTTSTTTHYAIKAEGQVISGEVAIDYTDVGNYEPFYKTELAGGGKIAEVLSVTDGIGHTYYEVEYLSQDTIFVPISNTGVDKKTVPSVLKAFSVPRRFVVVKEFGTTFLQFGYGSENELSAEVESIKDPSEVVLQLHGKNYIKDETFDPANLLGTDKLGISPSNTDLQIIYRINTSSNSNAAVNTLTSVNEPRFEFPSALEGTELNSSTMNDVVVSLEINNEEPILGDISQPSIDEVKHRIKNTFATQNRAVTLEDYENLVYRMPSQFGAIKKCHIIPDVNSFKRNLNFYILAEGATGNLTQISDTSPLKTNLKTWLNQYKMINDTIDILDAQVINIGIEFELISALAANKFDVLELATSVLRDKYREKPFNIGEPFFITDVYSTLNRVKGVSDTLKVKIVKKASSQYSQVYFNIDYYMSADGRYVAMPENGIFEVKFPNIDIKGTIK